MADPRVADSRVADLAASLRGHQPVDPREATSLRTALDILARLPAPFDEDADLTHVTASGIVHDGGGRVLLHRHKRLRMWLQPGGHIDPGEHPVNAAVREAREETGLRAAATSSGIAPFHVDVHPAARGHVHLDLRYLLEADSAAPLQPAPGESPDVAWFLLSEALTIADPGLDGALRRLMQHPARSRSGHGHHRAT